MDEPLGAVITRKASSLVALAVFPDHVMFHAGLFRLVGLREGERRSKGEAGNDETGGDMADHDQLHLKNRDQANHLISIDSNPTLLLNL